MNRRIPQIFTVLVLIITRGSFRARRPLIKLISRASVFYFKIVFTRRARTRVSARDQLRGWRSCVPVLAFRRRRCGRRILNGRGWRRVTGRPFYRMLFRVRKFRITLWWTGLRLPTKFLKFRRLKWQTTRLLRLLLRFKCFRFAWQKVVPVSILVLKPMFPLFSSFDAPSFYLFYCEFMFHERPL